MIVDRLETVERYHALNPLFERAFAWLQEHRAKILEPGRHDILGDALYVSVNAGRGRGHDDVLLEAHRKYIDIHLTLEGIEEIGWKSLAHCTRRKNEYESEGDCELFRDDPDCWTALPVGALAIYFPEDAHAPQCGQGEVRKYVVKVAVNPSEFSW